MDVVRTRHLIKAGAAGVAAPAESTASTLTVTGGTRAVEAPMRHPQIALHKAGERIDAIEVTCPCGHTMILDCEYPA
jgi:hypothetical protein